MRKVFVIGPVLRPVGDHGAGRISKLGMVPTAKLMFVSP